LNRYRLTWRCHPPQRKRYSRILRRARARDASASAINANDTGSAPPDVQPVQRQESSLRRKQSLRQKQRTGMRPNDEFYLMGRVPKTRG